MVILATPICTFERIFGEIADFLKPGCIVTDVGSTKALPHRWARRLLPKDVFYVGSHPVAGSEQRGVEFARDDLLEDANCILTATANTSKWAVGRLTELWSKLGCTVTVMTPQEHDRVLANVSHLPHIVAAALVNMTVSNELGFAGKGFSDATRIASSPANIWVDILLTNPKNVGRAVDRLIRQLLVMRRALGTADGKRITRLLNQARSKRARLIKHQMSREVGS
jgi:prephenate dehydrogenase